MDLYNLLAGAIFIAGGTYSFLLATGRMQIAPRDLDKSRQWRAKYGRFMKWAGPLMVVYGALQLLGIF
jgi:hypothetical protein